MQEPSTVKEYSIPRSEKIPAVSYLLTLKANLNNKDLTDKEFRELFASALDKVDFTDYPSALRDTKDKLDRLRTGMRNLLKTSI